MKEEHTQVEAIKLVGISARTCKANELDMEKSVIMPTVGQYMGNDVASKIQGRISPGVTYCVYTDYESDHNGEYLYFIGEAVEGFDGVEDGLSTLTIPAQSYVKYTTNEGPMPQVCISAWESIWAKEDAGGELVDKRAYVADFEVYDERAADPSKTVLDVYIGLKP